MKEIILPTEDVNSNSAKIVDWYIKDSQEVNKGDLLYSFETTKSLIDVEAEEEGFLLILAQKDTEAEYNSVVGVIFESLEELESYKKNNAKKVARSTDYTVTKKANQLAIQYNLDLAELGIKGIIKESDVEAFLNKKGLKKSEMIIMNPGDLPAGVKKVLVLGAGFGAMQVIDILLHDPSVQLVGCLDDDKSLHGKGIFGVPVLGGMDILEKLYSEKVFSHSIISISTSIPARVSLYEKLKSFQIPLVNAICPSTRVNRTVIVGEGNVIASNCHIGVATVIGDNNFISSNASIEHHNLIGSHNTTGPGVQTSSRVKIGDRIKFGMGIHMQPGISIGSNSLVSSGAILIKSVPDNSAVRIQPNYKIESIK